MKRHHEALIKMISDTVGEPKSGVEIGVFEADTSVELRRAFPDCELWLVDPWQEWGPGDSYHDKHKRTGKIKQERWTKIFSLATKRMAAAGGVNRIMQATSAWAAKVCDDGVHDFVFIDANHTYESAKEDITIWLPKIRTGGLICGHDYGGRYAGVKKAVHRLLGPPEDLILPGNRTRIWGHVV